MEFLGSAGSAEKLTNSEDSLAGERLVTAVTRLTELPESWAHEELMHVLAHSGQAADSLTLEQLRAAMLTYLESLVAESESSESFSE